jgi:hypothetical protein
VSSAGPVAIPVSRGRHARDSAMRAPKFLEVARSNGRSRLAGESVVPVSTVIADPPRSPASRLLQVMRTAIFSGCPIKGRSALAREKYPPVALANLTHRVRQQAGSYRFCVRRKYSRLPGSSVGRAWPRKISAHDIGEPDPLRSPASRLLQICARRKYPRLPGSSVGARLPAKNIRPWHRRT